MTQNLNLNLNGMSSRASIAFWDLAFALVKIMTQQPLQIKRIVDLATVIIMMSCASFAQQTIGTLRGQISDQLSAVVVGATVEAIDAGGQTKTVVTNESGEFVFSNLAPGTYVVRATAPGFSSFENAAIEIKANSRQQLNISLKVEIAEEIVTIAGEAPISTDAENNAGAIVLKGSDLDTLPENPEDLEAALQALAGPSSGPNGGQLFIDGFTDGRLPPKSSIREVRINSNPFSAEFDRVGFGRIEIFTKPGTNAFHGQAFFNFNDESLNSRNPFTISRDSYQSKQYGGNVSGALSKKASLFFDFENRMIDDLAVINATVVDSNFNITPFSQSFQAPLRRITFSPRLDYQINDTNTLTARYSFARTTNENAGIGGFSLASLAYNTTSTEHNIQLTETAIINSNVINETRFQFLNRRSNQNGDASQPTIQVLDAFTSGGSNIGNSSSQTRRFELQNYTSWTLKNHSFKAGARLRSVSLTDVSQNNFAGTYIFTSLEQYRNVLLGVSGATPTQLTLSSGNPLAQITQLDFAPFVQDDWRIRPNLTVNLGLRYEAQTNVSNNWNFAPRLGFAWAPDSVGNQSGKTVIRGGFGVFFDRISENLSLNANRYDGTNLQQFVVTDPALLALYPAIPSIDTLFAYATTQNTYRLAGNIRAPYSAQTNLSVERQLPAKFVLSATYLNTRGFNQLRVRNVNSPLNGVRPLGDSGNVFEYESTGRFNQNQLIFNLRNQFNRKFSFFASYILGKATSDTDGANSFPANSYDLTGEYGRSSLDVRHRFIFGGTVQAPLGLSLNPFLIASSGQPFNITSGTDTNGDSIFNDRPTYTQLSARCNALGLTYSFCDSGNVTDASAIIPRNYGTGPAFFTVNMRVSKTFGFGGESAGNSGGGFPGGGPGGGGPGGPGGPPPRGGGFGNLTSKRYNMTFSLQASNLLNNTNAGTPIGNLSSSLFGTSNSLASSFGFGPPGAAMNSAAYNRRLEAQVRFSW